MSINIRYPKTTGRIAICLMAAMLICTLIMLGTSPVSGDVGPNAVGIGLTIMWMM